MTVSKKVINIFVTLLILSLIFIYAFAQFALKSTLESLYSEGQKTIELLLQGQEDHTDLLEQVSLYREGLYALNLLLEARENVISGFDEENPFLVFDYGQVLSDLRRLLPKDASASSFQVSDKGFITIPVQSVSYASLGRVLRSFKNAPLFTEVIIPSAVQRAVVPYEDEFGLKRFKYIYSFVIQAELDPVFWQDPLPFKDVSNQDYFAEAIRTLLMNNSVEGYPDHLFRPHQAINRAEFYKLTLHALYANGKITLDEYSEAIDAPESLWYEKYLVLAEKADILFVNGADDPYHLERPISRIEALKTVMKIYEDIVKSEENKGSDTKKKKPKVVPFHDVSAKNEHYVLVQKAYTLQMLHPESFYKFFEPEKSISRAEVAYWVWKLSFDF